MSPATARSATIPSRGANARYGLGVILRPTRLGPIYGHSGFFPGYATEMLYFPDRRVAVAVQVSATNPYPRGLVPFLVWVVEVVGEGR